MKYDLDWFARNGAELPQEFEKLRLDEFHKRTDDAEGWLSRISKATRLYFNAADLPAEASKRLE
jgi:hypothetical protein